MAVQTIDVKALSKLVAAEQGLCLMDVRTPAEFDTVHAAGAKLLPLTELDPAKFMAGVGDPRKKVYLICKGGTRSLKAAELFVGAGYQNVVSVDGGTDAWVSAGLPVERSVIERTYVPGTSGVNSGKRVFASRSVAEDPVGMVSVQL